MEENKNVNVDEVVDSNTNKDEEAAETKFTQADVDSMISKLYEKWNKQAEKKIKQQQSLVGLDEKDRKLKEAELRAEEAEEKVKAFQILEHKQEVTKVLNARGLSVEFVDYLNLTDDTVANQQMIDKLDKLFKASVKAEVEKRIGGNTPRTSTIGLETGMTKEKYKQLNDKEKITYLMENPDFMKNN